MIMEQKGIEFTESSDIEKMEKLGFSSAPILFVNGKYYVDYEAIRFLQTL